MADQPKIEIQKKDGRYRAVCSECGILGTQRNGPEGYTTEDPKGILSVAHAHKRYDHGDRATMNAVNLGQVKKKVK